MSLAISLLCASLAMLCKQWLNHYTWTDVERSTIEHGWNRQRKLDSVDAWRFLTLMKILTVMLQFSLFFLGCVLSVSLWRRIWSAAVVVIIATCFGPLILVFVYIARMVDGDSPYQSSTYPRSLSERVGGVTDGRTALDLECLSWIIRTSLDEAIRLSALKYLMSIPKLDHLDPTLVADCFYIFLGCVNFGKHKATIRQGLEQLARVSAGCFFRTFHHLSTTHPTSNALKDLRMSHNQIFPPDTDFGDLPYFREVAMVHIVVTGYLSPRPIQWEDDRLSTQERVPLVWYMAQAAQVGYQQTQRIKVPRWILRFALDSLSLAPTPPASVIADSLAIVAIDLDCDVSRITVLEERFVYFFMGSYLSDVESVYGLNGSQTW
jgi:hypothetical protein